MTRFRSRLCATAAFLAVPALAGCATNFSATTDQVYIPGRGVDDRSSEVDVLAAVVVAPETGVGTLSATLVNNRSDRGDELVGVTIDGAPATISDEDGATELGPLGSAQLSDAATVTITGGSFEPGQFVEVVFTFASAESVAFEIPVVPNTREYVDVPLPSEDDTTETE